MEDRNNESDKRLDEDSNRISCRQCNGKFRDKKQFYEHHEQKHPNTTRSYTKSKGNWFIDNSFHLFQHFFN